VRDGIKGNLVERLFSRAHCPVSRLISTQWAGYIAFTAIRWLHGVGASFVHLGYDGTPLQISVPQPRLKYGSGHSIPAVRRKQALLTLTDQPGASIARDLLRVKLSLQIAALERLRSDRVIEAQRYADRLATADPALLVTNMLGLEGIVSVIYWQAHSDTAVNFGKRQAVPDHWRTFGARRSPLSGTPRNAVTPGNAMLSYLYGVLASEITIALHATGLDPALGIMHADRDDRASLVYDLIEPARPIVDRWFFSWLVSATFSKRDFIEGVRGQIHIMRPLSSHLAMTAPLWRGIAEQMAQWFYRCLDTGKVTPIHLPTGDIETDATHRATRWTLGNSLQRPIPRTCAECGKALPQRRRKFCSDTCRLSFYEGKPSAPGLAAIAALTAAQRSERARKANATLSSEQRRERARKAGSAANTALTPEQRSERSRKAWITRREQKTR
jgi:CRISPR-associated endonuclease Cas1